MAVVLFTKLGKVLVDTTGTLAVGAIGLTKEVLSFIMPENEVGHIPGASVGLAVLEKLNDTVRGPEIMIETLEGHLITLADYTSLARAVRSDDVTTQTLGGELGRAASSAPSTAGHTGSLHVASLRRRLAASPSNFVPLGPNMWKEVAREVTREVFG